MFHARLGRPLALASVVALAAGCGGSSQAPAGGNHAEPPVQPTTVAKGADVPVTYLPHPAFAAGKLSGKGAPTIADIAEKALPSVVNVSSTKVVNLNRFRGDPFFRHFFGPGGEMPRERRERGLGSGVIISRDGVILTNNHVVEGATEIRVLTSDKRELEARVIGRDPKSDLAVLKIQGKAERLVPITIGNSSRLRLGDVVLAIGNPFGVGQTVTMGIVSAKGRANVGIVDYEDFIQTDAAINPGNSGGALVNMEGELVGINTAILSRSGGYQGIGFAIPSNMARPIMESLVKHGKVVRGWLGVFIQGMDPDLAKAMSLPAQTKGVLIADVGKGGPAAKAGLKRGDVVQKIDGKAVDSPGKLRNIIAAAGARRKVKLELLRNGKSKRVTVALGEMPSDAEKIGRASTGGTTGVFDGLTLESLDNQNRKKFRISPSIRDGVLVVGVTRGSPAARAGLRPGDVLLEVNRMKVDSVASLKRAYQRSKRKVLVLLHRRGSTMFLVLKR